MFANAPRFDPTIPAIKVFCIGTSCLRSAVDRIAFDGSVQRGAVIHSLGDTTSSDSAPLNAAPQNAVRLLVRGAEKLAAVGYRTPHGDTLALVDIVTYPLYLSLIYDLQLTGRGTELFEINHNWLKGAFPDLPRMNGGVLSAFHFNEDPIDDAPTHNIVTPANFSLSGVARLLDHLKERPITISWVTKSSPEMDDRYLFAERQPGDGPPNRLIAE